MNKANHQNKSLTIKQFFDERMMNTYTLIV